ncbi:PadR family transcriptional regulator [Pseudalkalibacillus caeni]|uniref:PadR family transcriptional regulator n=1 Tax=Exobacillus caeni TaxID=2574798 RepID=A0A5R9F0U5_9BACL|nr:PadR family transcriptional regulator [Pseudalkalibacillus caeni]TLS37177.1 PadR family transcriptional regulator [Pseudalkalibacillus caeni]
MDERLKKLKKSMKENTFKGLEFTGEHRLAINEKIRREESEEDILLAVMQLLVREKTGFELSKLLRGRGIRKFEGNEGFLYSLLHKLEQKEYLKAIWKDESVKVYLLNNKGRRMLKKAEKKKDGKGFVLKELLEG